MWSLGRVSGKLAHWEVEDRIAGQLERNSFVLLQEGRGKGKTACFRPFHFPFGWMTSPDWKQASPAQTGRESQLALAFPKWPAEVTA